LITGSFGLNFSRAMPVVRVSLHLPGITQDFTAIDFLVDTGATDTYLHPQDAMIKVGISPMILRDPRRWPNQLATNGVGGRVTCYVQPAVYVFHHDDGREQQITHEIHIAPLTLTNATLPSLFGIDLLRHFRLSMDYVGQRLVLE
jgi:hypothetical protein